MRKLHRLLFVAPIALVACGNGTSAQGGAGDPTAHNGPKGTNDSVAIGCATPGATQTCCSSGTQTCSNGEFPVWGPCLDSQGAELSCGPCAGEFGSCDGGTATKPPSNGGGACAGEFASCDMGGFPSLCAQGKVNNEPSILVGYSPANGAVVTQTGQIKVWVNDEGAPIIAPGEQVDPNTGAITMPGDRTALALDGYLWEPALYIAPQTAESGGTPHFPTAIKGRYNNTTVKGPGTLVAGMDPPPPGSTLFDAYTGEDIWDVSSLGLAPGTYIAEFVVHDGDRDRGVGCITIVIQ